jgi:site-specific recombinase XerD
MLCALHRSGLLVLDVTFQKAIHGAVERAGFDKRVSPHTLRHSIATHPPASGVGIRDVQDPPGHADISTTRIYLHTAKQAGIGARRRVGFSILFTMIFPIQNPVL